MLAVLTEVTQVKADDDAERFGNLQAGRALVKHALGHKILGDQLLVAFEIGQRNGHLGCRLPDFGTLQRMNRFARYWDMVGNSGRFPRALPLLLADAPFERFLRFTDWLFATTGKTHEMALERLFEHVFAFLTADLAMPREAAVAALEADYEASGAKGRLSFMAAGLSVGRRTVRAAALRQARHVNA